MIRLNVL